MNGFVKFLPSWNGYYRCSSRVFPLPGVEVDSNQRRKLYHSVDNCTQSTSSDQKHTEECNHLQNNQINDPLRIMFLNEQPVTLPYPYTCSVPVREAYYVPLIEYAPFATFDLYKKFPQDDWHLTSLDMFGAPNAAQMSQVGDFVQKYDWHLIVFPKNPRRERVSRTACQRLISCE